MRSRRPARRGRARREALARIGRIFELDATLKDKPPAEIKRLRDAYLRPHAEALLAWIDLEYEKVRDQRGPLRSALGYGVRQKAALLRVLDDGRLVLDNNRAERALRGGVAIGRKAWLFVCATSAGMQAQAPAAVSSYTALQVNRAVLRRS